MDSPTLIAIMSLIGTLIIGAWNVRSAMIGASDEISKGAATMLAEYRVELDDTKTELSGTKIKLKCLEDKQVENETEIKRLLAVIAKMEVEYEINLSKLRGEVAKISRDYAILEKKHNELVKAYEQKNKENNMLSDRIEKLEKGDTGPLSKGAKK